MAQKAYFAASLVLLTAVSAHAKPKTERGVASWYGTKLAGHVTASGRIMDAHRLTAAHRTLPFGTEVEVRNRRNGRTVVVVVTDRGPGRKDRIIDLSPVAAAQLGIKRKGVAVVEVKPPAFE